MPTGYVKEIAKEKHKPVAQVESTWKKAERAAEKQGKDVGYGYVTNIFKKMSHVGTSKRSGGRSRGG